jgi:hypothetical protein
MMLVVVARSQVVVPVVARNQVVVPVTVQVMEEVLTVLLLVLAV